MTEQTKQMGIAETLAAQWIAMPTSGSRTMVPSRSLTRVVGIIHEKRRAFEEADGELSNAIICGPVCSGQSTRP